MKKLFPVFLIIISIVLIAFLVFIKINTKEKNKFTDADWEYMYNYIDSKYGNGEHLHIVSEKTDVLRKANGTSKTKNGVRRTRYNTLGISATIIGYFDSQDEIYVFKFDKYLNDQKNIKYAKAGKVICTAVTNGGSKEEYLSDNQRK